MSRRSIVKIGKTRRQRQIKINRIDLAEYYLAMCYSGDNYNRDVNIVHDVNINTGKIVIGVYAAHGYGVLCGMGYATTATREFPMWELIPPIKKTTSINLGVSMTLCRFCHDSSIPGNTVRVIKYNFEFDDRVGNRRRITRYVSIRDRVTQIPAEMCALSHVLENMTCYIHNSDIGSRQMVDKKRIFQGVYAGLQHIAKVDKIIALCLSLSREQCHNEMLSRYGIS
jgi:hypothetical protein